MRRRALAIGRRPADDVASRVVHRVRCSADAAAVAIASRSSASGIILGMVFVIQRA